MGKRDLSPGEGSSLLAGRWQWVGESLCCYCWRLPAGTERLGACQSAPGNFPDCFAGGMLEDWPWKWSIMQVPGVARGTRDRTHEPSLWICALTRGTRQTGHSIPFGNPWTERAAGQDAVAQRHLPVRYIPSRARPHRGLRERRRLGRAGDPLRRVPAPPRPVPPRRANVRRGCRAARRCSVRVSRGGGAGGSRGGGSSSSGARCSVPDARLGLSGRERCHERSPASSAAPQ